MMEFEQNTGPPMPARLLLVDDDVELTRLLTELLTHEGFAIEAQATGAGAAERAVSGGYDLVVLDVMLPDATGFEILKDIRRRSALPVILLTARGDDVDRIVGLEIGADDYVPKPFNTRELTARIRAVLRRADGRPGASAGPADRRIVRVDDVVFDQAARRVERGGAVVELTGVEFDLLGTLLDAAGETVTRDRLAETALGRKYDPFDRSVDMHVSNLRRKLGPTAGGSERIRSVRGVGYVYVRVPLAG